MPTEREYEPRESRVAIDPDKVAEDPGLLPYAHHVGSAIIRPIDKGRTRGVAMAAMYEQTGTQLEQIRGQVEVLIRQAQSIHDRIAVSESIYNAEVGFRPTTGQTYYLYERRGQADGAPRKPRVLSLVAPAEWGPRPPYDFVAEVRLLSDHTWEVVRLASEPDPDAPDPLRASA